jgi:drug/metabolite transporter (DMT)-like permease
MRTALLTVLALVAFAANSILCRLALRDASIDAASFSTIRIAGGAAALLLATASMRQPARASGSWTSAALLFLYAVPFSMAYGSLTAATGALILFGCVQLTMITAVLWGGERSRGLEWSGLALALSGLVYLLLPGLSAPPPAGAALMAVAGIAWGGYSVRGRRSIAPLRDTAGNFARAVPFALAVTVVMVMRVNLSVRGTVLALVSGILASGFGYVAWYAALRGLTGTRAALVQLSVPVLAACGGVVFLGERLSTRLVGSAGLVLGGIALALAARSTAETGTRTGSATPRNSLRPS